MLGVLIIDKAAGLTSHDVVSRVRHVLQERRVGHTGTLDPFATGLLVLLVGPATRLAQFLNGLEKEYEAVIRLGFATDTGDVTGKPLPNFAPAATPATFDAQQIDEALSSLRGGIDQVPPMYSAKKRQGRKLYELARRGEEVERQPVRVLVREFEVANQTGPLLKDNLDGTFDCKVRVVCSAGTYIRALAEDFGKRLGIGAHVAELRRTRVGHFKLQAAVTLERLQQIVAEESLGKVLVSPWDALAHFSKIELGAEEERRVRNGVALNLEEAKLTNGDYVRLRGAGHLVAVAQFDEARKVLKPRVVMPEKDS